MIYQNPYASKTTEESDFVLTAKLIGLEELADKEYDVFASALNLEFHTFCYFNEQISKIISNNDYVPRANYIKIDIAGLPKLTQVDPKLTHI